MVIQRFFFLALSPKEREPDDAEYQYRKAVLINSSAITEGPISAWRDSLGVSMIIPCFLIGMSLSLKF
jgi:hypothetical protein